MKVVGPENFRGYVEHSSRWIYSAGRRQAENPYATPQLVPNQCSLTGGQLNGQLVYRRGSEKENYLKKYLCTDLHCETVYELASHHKTRPQIPEKQNSQH
jgi:hypothetical protein